MDIDGDLLQTFREETNERLDHMVETLLAIERDGCDAELIGGLFRDAHSIKGNSGMLGFGEAEVIAHAMEDVLQTARSTDALAAELIDPLMAASDAIRRVVAGAESDGAAAVAALGAVAAEVRSRVNGDDPQSSPEPTTAVPSVTKPDARDLTQSDAPRSIRVAAEKVDRLLDVVGETVLHRGRLEHLIDHDAHAVEGFEEELDHGSGLFEELQHAVVQLRTLPLRSITAAYPRAVRDLAAAEQKLVRLEISGAETQLDRLILDGISETLVHLLRNCVSHGFETPDERTAAGKSPEGRLLLRAEPRGGMVAVSVTDDGRGVSPAMLELGRAHGSLAEVLAEAGVTTAVNVTGLSGRGVGLDAVKRHVESLGGSLEVESEPGKGSTVTLLLPLMLSLLHLLLIESDGQVFGIPLGAALEVVELGEALSLQGRRSISLRGDVVPVCDLSDVLSGAGGAGGGHAVIVSASGRRMALACDTILDEQEAVVKSLGPLLAGLAGYLGAVIMPDARIALILDPALIVHASARQRVSVSNGDGAPDKNKILVVDDQFIVRELERSILESAGYDVVTAEDGQSALEILGRLPEIALVMSDVDMPRMDGLELLREIRASPERASLPVVVITSSGGEEDRRRGADAGADAYVVKAEFAQDELLATVRRLIAL